MHLPRISLGKKLPLLFIAIATLPLIVLYIMGFYTYRNQFIDLTSRELQHVSQGASDYIGKYFSTKVLSLIIHSQTQAVIKGDIKEVSLEMQNLLLQDEDIHEIQLLNRNGQEVLHITRNKVYPQAELIDQSGNPAYKLTTFLGGTKYISPLSYENDVPVISIAVPVVRPEYSQSLLDLKTSSIGKPRQPDEIFGVLIEKVNLTNLWSYLKNLHIGKSGYIFVTDKEGKILYHPDKTMQKQRASLLYIPEVKEFVDSTLTIASHPNEEVSREKNEYGQEALMQHIHIPNLNWGLLGEASFSDTVRETINAALLIFLLLVVVLIVVTFISLSVSSQITDPIKALQQGSHYVGAGNLNYQLRIKTGDEIEDLANSFNLMATNLHDAFSRLERDKDILTAERNKIAITLSSINDIVIVVDMQKRIIIFNKAAERLMSVNAGDVIGKKVTEVFTLYRKETYDKFVKIQDDTYCPIPKTVSEGVVFSEKNLKLVSLNGKEGYVNIAAGQIKEGANADLGCILTMQDIGKEHELEEMKLDFVSIAAHELRTPLTSIKGYLSVFREEGEEQFTNLQKQFLIRMNIAVEYLVAIVENILNASRIERGVLTMDLKPVNWMDLIKEVADELRSRADEKKITITIKEPEIPLPLVIADRFRIYQVLTNLIANAINYTDSEGRIEIWTEEKEHEIITSIGDTGKGIPSEAIPHLFTKFFRVSGKLMQGSKGTGLGLYISRSIVEMHKGKIWVKSELDKGSIFSFSLQKNE